tara:strand:+ start:721 stop:942 length:222 start_codon:yes stop_codon:yes gene_type:complete
MQDSSVDQGQKNEGKVVSIFDSKAATRKVAEEENTEELSFVEIMRKNAENFDRMRKERTKSNKGVIRSYRLKT